MRIWKTYNQILNGKLSKQNTNSAFYNETDELFSRILNNVDKFEDEGINDKIKNLERQIKENFKKDKKQKIKREKIKKIKYYKMKH